MKKLKKSILITIAALFALSFTSSDLNAQSFEKGDIDVNFQVGFGTAWYYGTYYKMGLPFISVAGDYALKDDWGPGVFGVGAILGVSTVKTRWDYGIYEYGYKYTHFSIAPRATYHYQFVDKLDTYGGIATGITIRSGKEYGDYTGYIADDSGVHFIITAFVGVKYYVTNSLAIMSEIYVYDLATFNIGIGLKF
ncbi:MAG: hypothetical protein JXB24_11300 [Bacteroidales bacterium]|nr:hypothetical protein [Bacteroidales bacterium]